MAAMPSARQPTPTAAGGRAIATPPWSAALVLACVASAATLVILGSKLTFFNDDWYFLLQRPGFSADTLLQPHNGHLSVLAILIYKGLVATFGLASQVPFRVALAVTVVALGWVVHELVCVRCGRAAALVAATVIMFLGPAWEDLLWSFQVGFVGSLTAGLAALLVLERDRQRAAPLACALLLVAITLSDGGLPFVVAAAVLLLVRGRVAQGWVPAVPAAVFVAWYVTYGHDTPSHVSVANARALPRYVVDGASTALASLTGLNTGDLGAVPARGHLLLGLAVAAVGLLIWRRGLPSASTLVPLTAALTFWILAGLNYVPGREPGASRYQIYGATLLLLVAAELVRPLRPGRRAGAALLLIGALVLAANLQALHRGYGFMRTQAAYAKADLGALELAGGRVVPGFQLSDPVAQNPFLTGVTAQRWAAVTDGHGLPEVLSAGELRTAPVAQRRAADHVLAAAERVGPLPVAGGVRSSCVPVGTGGRRLPNAERVVRNTGAKPLVLLVHRLGPAGDPVPVGFVPARGAARIAPPRDGVTAPWLVSAVPATLALCRP